MKNEDVYTAVIDGQGGRLGRKLLEGIRRACPGADITAVYAKGYYDIFSPKFKELTLEEKRAHKGEFLEQYSMFLTTASL